MGMNDRPIDRELLHDYVDGELDSQSRLEMARYIGGEPTAAALVDAYRAQNEALQSLYGTAVEEPVPERMAELVARARTENASRSTTAIRERRDPVAGARRRHMLGMAAAALLALALGGAGGWWLHSVQQVRLTQAGIVQSFLDQAMRSYMLYAEGEQLDGGITADVAAWFLDHHEVKVKIPDLTAAGFTLVHSRVLPIAFGSAGQFTYADNSGHRVTVYIQASVSDSGGPGISGFGATPTFASVDDLSAYYWGSGGVTYALVGAMQQGDLSALVERILDVAETITKPAAAGAPE